MEYIKLFWEGEPAAILYEVDPGHERLAGIKGGVTDVYQKILGQFYWRLG